MLLNNVAIKEKGGMKMKKIASFFLVMLLLVATVSSAIAGEGKQARNGRGPAPNSGDCDPDGPGW